MVILRTRNKITDFLMILAWASPFKPIKLIFEFYYMANGLTFEILNIILQNFYPY